MPTFRSARPYVTAYGFQYMLGSREAGRVHTACFSASQVVLKTIRSNVWSSAPEGGHNDA